MSAAAERSIFVVYTGGTIGMRHGRDGYAPAPGFLHEQMRAIPSLRHPKMPRWTVEELDPLLDSSNMTPADWQKIAELIVANYESYDGFIVLHGTDTMAYSAAALSFMLENLAKPVIFTGSQIPLCEVRNDAQENLVASLLIAALYPIPEVCLFAGSRLLRGNRATKISAGSFEAFGSPNLDPLAEAGVEIKIREDLLRPPSGAPLRLVGVDTDPSDGPHLAHIRLFPGLSANTLRHFLSPPIEGVVLETYGLGNAPDRPDFLAAIRAATERGVVIVNCTQCLEGQVDMSGYATGHALRSAGVISGGDMTSEAAITKLYWLFSQQLPVDEVRHHIQRNLRGELTDEPSP